MSRDYLAVFAIILFLVFINFRIQDYTSSKNRGRLICVSEQSKLFSFGNNSQLADLLWLNFIQEIDAFNELKIVEAHLCPDKVTSWHYHTINLGMELDPNFYEMAAIGPLIISVTISDAVGASILFDKAVKNFPNNWKILYQASYQAQFEEKNYKKAADLLFRAGKNGAPLWVYSLAGGLYNRAGLTIFANSVYEYLVKSFPEDKVTQRLKDKLENKVKNFYEKESN